mmetsp:Transcript_15383/g.22649  ORF Transcript_15383/g.22649 Transcript_15383/m.22649 type:complete len:160 (-) Transcript_15383:214-693(-)
MCNTPPEYPRSIARHQEITTITAKAISVDSQSDNTSSVDGSRRTGSVSFSTIETREYERIVLDSTEETNIDAPLLSIGWNYEEQETVRLDDYEATRGDRLPMNSIRVYPTERKMMLKEFARARRKQEYAALPKMKRVKKKIHLMVSEMWSFLSADQPYL